MPVASSDRLTMQPTVGGWIVLPKHHTQEHSANVFEYSIRSSMLAALTILTFLLLSMTRVMAMMIIQYHQNDITTHTSISHTVLIPKATTP